jgi:hypothetical protein
VYIGIKLFDYSFFLMNRVIIFVFCTLCCNLLGFSQTSTWDGIYPAVNLSSNFSGGDGSESSPYLIGNAFDLAQLCVNVNISKSDDAATYSGKYFRLIRDLDLKNNPWTPIGLNRIENANSGTINYCRFCGYFDGNGHSIKNVFINIEKDDSLTTPKYTYGLFGVVGKEGAENGQIKNLVIDGMTINIDFPINTKIYDGMLRVGCFVGMLGQSGSVVGCIVKNATIKANETNAFMDNGTPGLFIGGIVGDVAKKAWAFGVTNGFDGINIENCFADVDIDLSKINNGKNNGQFNVGGIVGRLRSANQYPVNCVYTGSIIADGLVGPIFGAGRYASESLTDNQGIGKTFNGGTSPATVTNNWYYELRINNVAITGDTKTVAQGTGAITFESTDTYYHNYQGICSERSATELTALNGANSTNLVTGSLIEASPYTYNSTAQMFEDYENAYGIFHIIYDAENNTFDFLRLDLEETFFGSRTYKAIPSFDADYSYEWLLDGQVVDGATGNTLYVPLSASAQLLTVVLKLDDNIMATNSLTIPEVNLRVEIVEEGSTLKAQLYYNDLQVEDNLITINGVDYNISYQWFYEITQPISGGSSPVLSGYENKKDYRLKVSFNNNGNISNLWAFHLVQRVIYVSSSSGNDNYSGTALRPVKTLLRAFQLLPSEADRGWDKNIIVLMDAVSTNELFNQNWCVNPNPPADYAKNVTITGSFDGNEYASAQLNIKMSGETHIYFWGDVQFKNLTLNGTSNGSLRLYMQGHDLNVGEGVKVTGAGVFIYDSTTGGISIGKTFRDFSIIGGWFNYNGDYTKVTDLPYEDGHLSRLTFCSGNFARVIGGSRNDGALSQSKNIFGHKDRPWEVEINVMGSSEINLIAGGQCDGTTYCKSTINISNGIVGRVMGGNLSYGINITGVPSNSYFGSSSIRITGGKIYEIYGGSLGRSRSIKDNTYYYGAIDIELAGGTIDSTVYSSGAGGVMGYDPENGDIYKDWGESYETSVKTRIYGGTINGNVYGGGYGHSSYLNSTTASSKAGSLYGDSELEIHGGTITGSVFGGGRGYFYDAAHDAVGQLHGNSSVLVAGGIIKGNVFGGGMGVEENENIAKVCGNASVIVTGGTIGDWNENTLQSGGCVYGGPDIAKMEGITSVNVSGGKLSSVFGAGRIGSVEGDAYLTVSNNVVICNNVIGGGDGETASVSNTEVCIDNATIKGYVIGGGYSGNVTGNTNVLISLGSGNRIYGYFYYRSETFATLEDLKIMERYYVKTDETTYVLACDCGVWKNGYTFNPSTTYYTKELLCAAGGGYGVEGYGGEYGVDYGGNVEGNCTLTINGGEFGQAGIEEGKPMGDIFGGGLRGYVTGNVVVNINGTPTTTKIHNNVYGAGLYGDVNGEEGSSVIMKGGTVLNVFAGGWNGNVKKCMLLLQPEFNNENVQIVEAVYGGGDLCKVTGTATLQMDGGYVGFYPYNYAITPYPNYYMEGMYDYGSPVPNTYRKNKGNIFGGGFGSVSSVGKTEVILNGGFVKNSVYGGGEMGSVGNDVATLATCLHLNGGGVGCDIYGAGMNGLVTGQTLVSLEGTRIEGNVFGGAYGSLNKILCVGLKTVNIIDGVVMGNVHGGSRNSDDANVAVAPEISSSLEVPESTAFVNIYGGHLYHNVYGGGFYGKLFGSSVVNVGYNAVNNAPRKADNVHKHATTNAALPLIIDGSIYAGTDWGDPAQGNNSNKENAYGNTDIYIDGTGYEQNSLTGNYMLIKESLYGSGTTCHGGRMGRSIWIRNFGQRIPNAKAMTSPSESCTRTFLSIQRCDDLILDNSHIMLLGQKDATSFENTKTHSLLYVRNTAKIANGSTIMISAPLDSINSLQSVSCEDIYENPQVCKTIGYSDLSEHDNYLRVNGGHYVSVRMGKEELLKYNELKGFFYLEVENNTKSFLFARRKFSDLNQDDGGFVSFTAENNTFDANGNLASVSGNEGVQIPYTNRPSTRANEPYRYWQYGNGDLAREGVLIARRDANNTTDTYLTSDCRIELPAAEDASHYFKLNSLVVGDDIFLADAAKSSSSNWMTYDSDGNPKVLSDQSIEQVPSIDAKPNNTFGLVMIPSGGLQYFGTTGYDPATQLPAQFLRKGIHSDVEDCLKFNVGDINATPVLNFKLTYNNAISASRELGDIVLTIDEFDGDNNKIQSIKIHLLVITLSDIPQDMTLNIFALMKGKGSKHDTYKLKMVLPDFGLASGQTKSDFTLTAMTISSAAGLDMNMHKTSWFDENEGDISDFGLTFNAAYGSDNSNGWLTMANDGNPIDVMDIETPIVSPVAIGSVDCRNVFTFDFTLHYNGKLSVAINDKIGSVVFCLEFTNKAGATVPLKMEVTIDIYRKGTTSLFYLDGVNGDNGNDGCYPDKAKKTLNGVLDMGYTCGDIIFVVDTVIAKNSIPLDWDGSSCNHITLMRYPGEHALSSSSATDPGRFFGPLVVVNKNMVMTEITLDGGDTLVPGVTYVGYSFPIIPEGCNSLEAKSPLVLINKGADLSMTSNSALVNNTNTATTGTLNLGGGAFLMSEGKLTVRDGSQIVDNKVASGQKGGGVYVQTGGELVVGGDVLIHNNLDADGNKRNVYLPGALDRITIGEIGDNMPGALPASSSIGITKDIPVGNDTTQVAYSSSVDYILSPLSDPTIIYDDQDIYDLLYNSLWDKNRLFFTKTWASVVTSKPDTGYVTDVNGNVKISTPEGLAWMISKVNGINGQEAYDFEGKTVEITCDVGMGAHEWVPIGTMAHQFKGTFNGNGYDIDSVHCSLPYLDAMGLFGHVGAKGLIENTMMLDADFSSSNMTCMGILAGLLHDSSVVRRCETAGRLITVVDAALIGGVVGGLSDQSSLYCSFSTTVITSIKSGGLVGEISPKASVKNCFARSQFFDISTSAAHNVYAGGITSKNEGTIENCYVHLNENDEIQPWTKCGVFAGYNSGKIHNCYVSEDPSLAFVYTQSGLSSEITGCGTYPYTQSYENNKITLGEGMTSTYVTSGETTLLEALQNWQKANPDFEPWMRTTSIINNDFPIIKMSPFTTVSSPDGGMTLYYDRNFAEALHKFNNRDGGAVMTLYANEDIRGTNLSNDNDVILYINEDVSLLHNSMLKAYVGITLDNSGPGTFSGGDYDWHMISSSLSNSPIGLQHNVKARVNYGLAPIKCTQLAEGIFPQDLDYEKWDFYCYYEPQYHWINFKRNSNSHWHEDGDHQYIEYGHYPNNSSVSDPIVFGNEDSLIQGKGYMAAVADETFLQSPGLLAYGDVIIPVTYSGLHCTGYNLIGNPYQSRLDFDMLASENTWNTKDGYTPSYYVIDADKQGYISYSVGASVNPETASRYIHMHQGFFILANQNTTLKFTDAMRVKEETSTFRGQDEERPNYPLVNLKVTDNANLSDLMTVELGRPELGGAEKMTELMNAKCLLYARHQEKDYSLLFLDEPLNAIPVWFEPQENGTFTMSWSTANGTFSYLHLIDNITGIDVDCLSTDSYSFTASTSDYKARFKLALSYTGLDEDLELKKNDIFAFECNGSLIVNGEGLLQLIDMNGRILFADNLYGVQNTIQLPDVAKGVYVLRLAGSNETQVQKYIIK